MRKIRMGVIGCGSRIAQEYHFPALKQVEGVVWKYACDTQLELARKIAKQYGFEKATDNYREVLADQDVDMVVILTRVDMHAQLAIEAAKAGKHIFMQKSIACSLEDAQKVVDEAKANGVKLAISFMHRYFDESIEARKIIQSNALGEIHTVRVRNFTRNSIDKAGLYGGAMMDIASHGIDLVRALFGQEIIRVKCLQLDGNPRAYGWKQDLRGDDTYSVAMYELADHMRVIHEAAWAHVSQVDRFDVEIHGAKGALYMKHEFVDAPLLLGIAPNGAENEVFWSKPYVEKTFWGERQHRLFIEDLQNGTSNSLTAEDGFTVLAVTEAICRSSKDGNWERPVRLRT